VVKAAIMPKTAYPRAAPTNKVALRWEAKD
jgi:hypothetical protein